MYSYRTNFIKYGKIKIPIGRRLRDLEYIRPTIWVKLDDENELRKKYNICETWDNSSIPQLIKQKHYLIDKLNKLTKYLDETITQSIYRGKSFDKPMCFEMYSICRDLVYIDNLINQKRIIKKLSTQIRSCVTSAFHRKKYNKKAHTEEIIGLPIQDFIEYLKKTWYNNYDEKYINQPCHIDHIIPISTAKTEEEIYKLNHYTNLQLLTPYDNLSKHDSLSWTL